MSLISPANARDHRPVHRRVGHHTSAGLSVHCKRKLDWTCTEHVEVQVLHPTPQAAPPFQREEAEQACGADLNDSGSARSAGQRALKQLNSAPLVGKRSALTATTGVLPERLFTAMLIHLALCRRCAPTNACVQVRAARAAGRTSPATALLDLI